MRAPFSKTALLSQSLRQHTTRHIGHDRTLTE